MSPEPPPFPAAWFVIISTDLRLVFRHFGLWNSKLKKTKKTKIEVDDKTILRLFYFHILHFAKTKKTSRRLKHKSCRKMAEVHRVFGTLAANNLLAIQCLWHFQLSTTQQPEVPLSPASKSTDRSTSKICLWLGKNTIGGTEWPASWYGHGCIPYPSSVSVCFSFCCSGKICICMHNSFKRLIMTCTSMFEP